MVLLTCPPAPGPTWLPLAPPGSTWRHLAPPGTLAPPGSTWLLLAPSVSSWLLLPWLPLLGIPWPGVNSFNDTFALRLGAADLCSKPLPGQDNPG